WFDTGRGGNGEECLLHLYSRECRLDVTNVPLERCLPCVPDRSRAHQRGAYGTRTALAFEFGVELGEGFPVFPPRHGHLARRGLSLFETAKAVTEIAKPAGLTKFAIADNINADFRLLLHDLRHGVLQALVVYLFVVWLVALSPL